MIDTNAARAAIIVPGLRYGPSAPLLMYAGAAAENRGAKLFPISWLPPDDLTVSSRNEWVSGPVTAMLDKATAEVPDAMPLLVGKSLGTYAAGIAADRVLPAVWLTPVLTDASVVEALRHATAPYLLVGGTDDELWDGDLARQLSPHVLEIDGADHGMFVPGVLAASAAVLGRVVTAVEEFLDNVVWPLPGRST